MNNHHYFTRTFTLPDGRRKYVRGKTAAEADRKLLEAKIEAAGGLIPSTATTFREVADLWIAKYKAPFLRDSSLHTLRSNVQAHLLPRFGNVPIQQITTLQCQTCIAELVSAGLTTAGATLSHLRAIFSVAVELGLITKSPVSDELRVPQPEKKRGEVDILPATVEAAALEKLCPLSPEHIAFMLGKETGLRRGELFALRWDCVDLDKGVIHVRRNLVKDKTGKLTVSDKLKTRTSRRSLPISPVLQNVLLKFSLFGESGFVLHQETPEHHYSVRNITTLVAHLRQVFAETDKGFAEGFTLHALRHTFITRLFEAGLDVKEVQRLAGHKDVTTTLGLYTHYNESTRLAETFTKVREYFTVGA